jgi:hypothetical protein
VTSVFNPLLDPGRHDTLDRTIDTPDLEELSFKVYRRSIRLVGVSEQNSAHKDERLISSH